MCSIDFGMPVDRDDNDLLSSLESTLEKLQNSTIERLKRKLISYELDSRHSGRNNFEVSALQDPVLFVGHLSENSILIIDKPWMRVVKTFDAPPVHRHIYGT